MDWLGYMAAGIHKLRMSDTEESRAGDFIVPIANQLSKEAWLLCFDELQVSAGP